jgi:hypothetical protein
MTTFVESFAALEKVLAQLGYAVVKNDHPGHPPVLFLEDPPIITTSTTNIPAASLSPFKLTALAVAKKKLLRCPRCPRTFALPLHLGKHLAWHRRRPVAER